MTGEVPAMVRHARQSSVDVTPTRRCAGFPTRHDLRDPGPGRSRHACGAIAPAGPAVRGIEGGVAAGTAATVRGRSARKKRSRHRSPGGGFVDLGPDGQEVVRPRFGQQVSPTGTNS